jgi:uncharacterized protein YjeT (DUF2065 family)
MNITRIIGIFLVLIGAGILFAFSGESLGLFSSIIIIIIGLILTFLNRRGQI